jgi:hypothetical protein
MAGMRLAGSRYSMGLSLICSVGVCAKVGYRSTRCALSGRLTAGHDRAVGGLPTQPDRRRVRAADRPGVSPNPADVCGHGTRWDRYSRLEPHLQTALGQRGMDLSLTVAAHSD